MRDAAERALLDLLSAADHFADQQIAKILREPDHEADELAMEVAVDHRARRRGIHAVVEGAPISGLAVPLRVAQRLPLLEQIQAARAGSAVHPQPSVLEQTLEHVDHLEHFERSYW